MSSVAGVVMMLSRGFALLVTLANVVAWPIGYYIMSDWLDSFAYRTDLSPALFVFAGCLTGTIATVTVGYLALRAARANPVDALRRE